MGRQEKLNEDKKRDRENLFASWWDYSILLWLNERSESHPHDRFHLPFTLSLIKLK